jgi:DNA-binding NarL/FixJ family response regulator
MNFKVFIVDDHAIVRTGLGSIINEEDYLEVCGYAESSEEAIKKIAILSPDIIVVDINLKGKSGIDLVHELRSLYPKLPALVFSMYDEMLYAPKAISAGAKGYVMKTENPEKFVEGIKQILNGKTFFNPEIKKQFDKESSNKNEKDDILSQLSKREFEILRLYGKGFSTAQIAENLSISPKTVNTYRDRIRSKLNLKSSHDIVRLAVKRLQLYGN